MPCLFYGIPTTLTGRRVEKMIPFPNSPLRFSPQQDTVPSVKRAHECWLPAATAATLLSPMTTLGIADLSVVPFPS